MNEHDRTPASTIATGKQTEVAVLAGGCFWGVEENVSTRQPAVRISNSMDSRTETSSSTTNTIGVECATEDPGRAEVKIPPMPRRARVRVR